LESPFWTRLSSSIRAPAPGTRACSDNDPAAQRARSGAAIAQGRSRRGCEGVCGPGRWIYPAVVQMGPGVDGGGLYGAAEMAARGWDPFGMDAGWRIRNCWAWMGNGGPARYGWGTGDRTAARRRSAQGAGWRVGVALAAPLTTWCERLGAWRHEIPGA